MKNQKVILGAIMLLLTVVALTTATFAWFSTNTNVSLEGLEINVTAAQGIQVSTDAATWKAAISILDITDNAYTGHINQVPSVLAPVSTIGSQSVGNFEMFDGDLSEGGTTTLTTIASAAEAAGSSGNYIAFDLFVRSATEEEIFLSTGSGVTAPLTSVGLEYSVRIGFFNQGTDATSTPSTAVALATGTNLTQKIWEPNALDNTTYALSNGATVGVKETYYGVKAAGTGLTVTDFAGDTTHFEVVSTITPDSDTTPFDDTVPANSVFTAYPGITKVRVYIWVEGQDIDNENSVSLGTDDVLIEINLHKVL